MIILINMISTALAISIKYHKTFYLEKERNKLFQIAAVYVLPGFTSGHEAFHCCLFSIEIHGPCVILAYKHVVYPGHHLYCRTLQLNIHLTKPCNNYPKVSHPCITPES